MDYISVIFSGAQVKSMLKKNVHFENPQGLKELLTTL